VEQSISRLLDSGNFILSDTNKKLVLGIAVALIGSIIFGCLMAYRVNLTESWMRSVASGLAFVILGGAFVIAYRFRNDDF
jgi:undecaprenyl pyrophosphate phosphatase UppP